MTLDFVIIVQAFKYYSHRCIKQLRSPTTALVCSVVPEAMFVNAQRVSNCSCGLQKRFKISFISLKLVLKLLKLKVL